MAGHEVSIASLSLSSSSGQGGENRTKGSCVKLRAGKDHILITITGKTDTTQGN